MSATVRLPPSLAFMQSMWDREKEKERREPFSQRGFSEKTIDALMERGITYPEHLLFASEADLKALGKDLKLPKARLAEIKDYVLRFRDQEARR